MSSSSTIHLKIEKNVQVHDAAVYLKDIAEVTCADRAVEYKVKALKVPNATNGKPGRKVLSVMEILSLIYEAVPNAEVDNIGEADFIITYEKENQPGNAVCWLKTVLVALTAFFGAAFAIMTFHNDVDIPKLFAQIYEQFTGTASDGFTILEFSYSVGVGVGILVFFNHFAGKNLKKDPTPLEVEMRLYEDDVDTTLLEAGRRKPEKEQKDRKGGCL